MKPQNHWAYWIPLFGLFICQKEPFLLAVPDRVFPWYLTYQMSVWFGAYLWSIIHLVS